MQQLCVTRMGQPDDPQKNEGQQSAGVGESPGVLVVVRGLSNRQWAGRESAFTWFRTVDSDSQFPREKWRNGEHLHHSCRAGGNRHFSCAGIGRQMRKTIPISGGQDGNGLSAIGWVMPPSRSNSLLQEVLEPLPASISSDRLRLRASCSPRGDGNSDSSSWAKASR